MYTPLAPVETEFNNKSEYLKIERSANVFILLISEIPLLIRNFNFMINVICGFLFIKILEQYCIFLLKNQIKIQAPVG
jgi:hypothetical protein